jgi:hypothetical protein
MVDLPTLFYGLGIVFFMTCFVILIVVIVGAYGIYSKISKARQQLPIKILTYFRDNNSAQLKTMGVALVGVILAFLRGRVQKKT